MSDDRQNNGDDHELTFESGYGAQDKVLKDGESLEDVAGVSEEDIRKDMETQEDEASGEGED